MYNLTSIAESRNLLTPAWNSCRWKWTAVHVTYLARDSLISVTDSTSAIVYLTVSG
jgi:hypothetical protein